jgi:hypothetical protein
MLRDELDLIGNDIYIGMTILANQKINRIQPLAVARPDGWLPISIANANDAFPEKGTVFTVDHSLVGREDVFVLFTTVPTQGFISGHGHDRSMTDSVCEPFEILSTFETKTPDERRKIASISGMRLGNQTLPRVILPLGGGKCAFPKLKFYQNESIWLVSPNEDLGKICLYEADDSCDGGLSFDGRSFALPGRYPSREVALINWQTDADFFGSIVKLVKNTADIQPGSPNQALSKSVIERLQTFYSRSQIFNGASGEMQAVRERLGEFLTKLEDGQFSIDEIANALMKNPAVKQSIDDIAQREAEATRIRVETKIKDEVRAKAEAEMATLFPAMKELNATIAELERDKQTLAADITELKRLREVRVVEVESSFGALLQRFKEGGDRFAQLIANLKSVGIVLPTGASETSRRDFDDPPWNRHESSVGAEVTLDEFPGVLGNAAKTVGLPLEVVAKFDIATRSGEIAIAIGPAAEFLLDLYASCFAAGAVYRVALDPTVLGIDDLWINPTRQRETAFAAGWKSALEFPDRPHLVCLDDLDSASLSNWFPWFAKALRRSRPANLFVVATRSTLAANAEPNAAPDGDAGIVVEANSNPNLATSILMRSNGSSIPRRVLSAPRISLLDDDERSALVSFVAGRPSLGPADARRLMILSASAKSWKKTNPDLSKLPFAMVERGTRSIASPSASSAAASRDGLEQKREIR